MAEQVARWTLGSTETTVERIAPEVVEIRQETGDDPTWVDGVTLTRDEVARIIKAMGWAP